jgi:hypothetical protein
VGCGGKGDVNRKFRIAAIAVIAAAGLALVEAGAAVSRTGPAATRVTIGAWPKGLVGYVSSSRPARCAARRFVLVFRQRGGRRNPARDKRIARVRSAGSPGAYQWSVKTNARGRFYAKVAGRRGCRGAYSRTSVLAPARIGSGGPGADYPPCGPYISEGTSTICKFDQLQFDMRRESAACDFGVIRHSCEAFGVTGPFPWGVAGPQGSHPAIRFSWQPSDSVRSIRVDAGRSYLSGTVPSSSSPAFTIIDAYAEDDRGFPSGDHFFTPDIPGQAAGEVGGPLYLNYVSDEGRDHRGTVFIRGYLYLRRPSAAMR